MALPCARRSTGLPHSVAIALLALAACSPVLSTVDRQPSDAPVGVGARTSVSARASMPAAAPLARGTLEVIVTDTAGRRRPEIEVRIRTPDARVLRRVTDERGVVRERLAPGYYGVRVATGCQGRMQITFGGSGRVSLTPRAIVRAPLRVEAIRRYAAGPPLLRSKEPPWRRNAPVDLYFRLYDRCTDQIMQRFSFHDLSFRPSGHLTVVDAFARRTDAKGIGKVRVRCIRPGPAELILGDPANPNDGEDLLSFTPPLDPNAEWCA